MANIPKAKQAAFVEQVCEYLEEMGCTKTPKGIHSYYTDTKYGEFGITVDKDKSILFTICCRFSNPQRMPAGLTANYYSGKYNLHQWDQRVDDAVGNVKDHLNKILSQ